MSDADKIKVEVERRKQRAWQLELPTIVTDFYRELARFYPKWKESHPALVPQSLAGVGQVGEDSVELTYQGNRYVFAWNEHAIDLPNGDVSFSSTIELLFNDTRVFEVYLQGEFDEYIGTQWRPCDVRAFIEGPWVAGLKALAAEGKRLYTLDQDQAETRKRGEQLAELQTRFGITADRNAGDMPYRVGVLLGAWLKRFLKRF